MGGGWFILPIRDSLIIGNQVEKLYTNSKIYQNMMDSLAKQCPENNLSTLLSQDKY